jgi:hypothetical protein
MKMATKAVASRMRVVGIFLRVAAFRADQCAPLHRFKRPTSFVTSDDLMAA